MAETSTAEANITKKSIEETTIAEKNLEETTITAEATKNPAVTVVCHPFLCGSILRCCRL